MTTSFASSLTAIVTHMTASGAAMSPPITDIRTGEPIPTGNCIAVWYEGDIPAPHWSEQTMATAFLGERVMIRLYLKVVDRTQVYASTVETQLQAFNADMSTRLDGNRTLGGACNQLTVEHGSAGWANVEGSWFRIFDLPVVVEFIDVNPITA